MKWKMRELLPKQLLFPVFMWCFLWPPSLGFSWTQTRWLGVVEAAAGTAVLRADVSPSSDVCDNCGGTGRLGDGVVSVECPVCDGTGKPTGHAGHSFRQACPTCDTPDTISKSPALPGMAAPAVKQDAATSGGGSFKRRLFRRR